MRYLVLLLLAACGGPIVWTPRLIAGALDDCLYMTRYQEKSLRDRWCWEPAACRAQAIKVPWSVVMDEYTGLPNQRGPHLCIGRVVCHE